MAFKGNPFFIVGYNVLIGLSYCVIKVLVSYCSPLWAAGIRSIFTAFIVRAYFISVTGKEKRILDRETVPYVVRGTFFRVAIPSALVYWALQYVSPLRASLFLLLAPFVMFFYSYVFLKEKMTTPRALGLIIAFSSIIPLLVKQPHVQEISWANFFTISLADLAFLAFLFVSGYGALDMKRMVIERPHISYVAINAYGNFFGGLLLVVCAYFFEGAVTIKNPLLFCSSLSVAILTVNIAAANLYSWLLKTHSLTLMAIVNLSSSFFAGIFSWLLFGTGVGWDAFVSAFIVFIAVVVFHSGEIIESVNGAGGREKNE